MKNFDPHHDHMVDQGKARSMVAEFQTMHADATGGVFAHIVSRKAILGILSHPDAAGLKAYRAITPDGSHTLVFAGVDAAGAPCTAMIDDTYPCPPFCNPNNPDEPENPDDPKKP